MHEYVPPYLPPPESTYYSPTDDYTGHAPYQSDYWHEVEEFNPWEIIWDQDDYEIRLEDEATLMIALEAMKEATIQIEAEVAQLDTCIAMNS